MDIYQSEEEQVESLKKWWSENSRSIILGISIGLISIFGWQGWKSHVQTQSIEASALYQQLTKAMQGVDSKKAILIAENIKDAYSSTPYAALAGLQKAQAQVQLQNIEDAIEELVAVADTASDPSIQHVARLRALRLRLNEANAEMVLKDIAAVLGNNKSGKFMAQYEVLKGDANLILGDVEQARLSYILALENTSPDSPLTQLKLDNLGPAPVSNMLPKKSQDEAK